MTLLRLLILWLCVVTVWSSPSAVADDESMRGGNDFFENKIRPVLVKRCFACHAGEKREGKLRLDRRDALLQGGRSGRVVLPGDPSGSLLIRAIRRVDKDVQMPPDDDDQLTAEEIQNFVAWVKMGVPFPGDGSGDAVVKPSLAVRSGEALRRLDRPRNEWPSCSATRL